MFFVGAGEKTLSLKHVQPLQVSASESAHPVLDNLKISKSSSTIKYQSLSQSIEFFLEQFPHGFYGDKFNMHERGYKDKAHALAKDLLSEEAFSELLKSENFVEIAKRALKIVNATNLIFPNEKMSLKDALVDVDAQKHFAHVLFSLLYGHGDLEERFVAFAALLENLNAAKWTTATYFLFVVHPSKYMFIKPTITQYSSELCGFEINYQPQLNWLTYRSVLSFSEYLFSQLAELNPRDMIDVQSFMWCIAPGTYDDL